jgi:hypothetical protein
MSPNLKQKKSNKKELSYEDIGKMLVSIYESGYIDRKQLYKMSLLKGMLQGFGGVLGATILVAILLWILSLASHIPLLDRVVQNVKQTVQTQKH